MSASRRSSPRPRRAASADLKRGRDAYARRAWADAFECLAAADREGPLDLDDLERLAWSAGLTGHDQEMLKAQERLHQAHLDAGNVPRAVRAAFWLAFRLLGLGERGRATAWLAQAQSLVERDGQDCPERGYLLLPSIYQHLAARDDKAALAAASAAVECGDRFGDADLAAIARNFKGMVLLRLGRIGEGLALFDEAMLAATSRDLSPIITGLVYCNVVDWCQRVFALDRAREWTTVLTEWCEAQPQLVVFTGRCRAERAAVLQLHGDWTEAIEEARRAADRSAISADPEAAGPAHYQRAEIHRLRGEYAEAAEAYRESSRFGRDPQPGLGLLRLAEGDPEAAVRGVSRALAATQDPWQRARFLPALVEIAIARGDLETARQAVSELDRTAGLADMDVLVAMAAHARGALALAEGNAHDALAPLRAAFSVWHRMGAPYLAARIRVLVGHACHALGDHEGAELEWQAARGVFHELGAAPDLTRLGQAGQAPPERHHALTPREVEVLRLVASGKTNKSIAAALFLSEKTIDRHVSNILGKLDLPSRAAATAWAYENELI